MDKPEIKPDVPIELTNAEYRFVVEHMTGMVFHRRDDEGRAWVKTSSARAMKMLDYMFGQSRPAVSASPET